MERHHSRLADTENKGRQQPWRGGGGNGVFQDTTGDEIKPPGHQPDINHRRQQQNHRTADKNAHIEAAGIARCAAFLVGNKREGRKGQDLVENEQHKKIARPGNRHRGMHRHRVESREPRLVLFMIATHIADRIERRQNPQARGDKSENSAKRRHPEGKIKPGRDLGRHPGWRSTCQNNGCHLDRADKGHQRANGTCDIAPVRPDGQKRHQQCGDKRREDTDKQRCLGVHQHDHIPPVSCMAARMAASTSGAGATPNHRLPIASIHSGR